MKNKKKGIKDFDEEIDYCGLEMEDKKNVTLKKKLYSKKEKKGKSLTAIKKPEISIWEKLNNPKKKIKKIYSHFEKIEKERNLLECTFKPKISKNINFNFYSKNQILPVSERLYIDAKEKQEKKKLEQKKKK